MKSRGLGDVYKRQSRSGADHFFFRSQVVLRARNLYTFRISNGNVGYFLTANIGYFIGKVHTVSSNKSLPWRGMATAEAGDYLKGYVIVHGDNSAAGATKTVGVAGTLYQTRYQIGDGMKADCDLALAEDKNPANNFGFARFNRWHNTDPKGTQDSLRRTTVVKGETNPKAGTFGIVCSPDGKTVDIYYRSQGAADAQYAYFPLVSDGKKLDQLPRNKTGNVTVPFTVTVWNNGKIYKPAVTRTAIAPKVVNAGGSSTAQPGKLTVVKKGNGLEAGQRFITGYSVDSVSYTHLRAHETS